jgi:hypothetical protein
MNTLRDITDASPCAAFFHALRYVRSELKLAYGECRTEEPSTPPSKPMNHLVRRPSRSMTNRRWEGGSVHAQGGIPWYSGLGLPPVSCHLQALLSPYAITRSRPYWVERSPKEGWEGSPTTNCGACPRTAHPELVC